MSRSSLLALRSQMAGHPGPEVGPVTEVTFAEALACRAYLDPDREVVRLRESESWTGGELWHLAATWAAGLRDQVSQGDVVATTVPAGPWAIALTAAISALGGVELPLAPDLDREWGRCLGRRAALLVTTTTAVARQPLLADIIESGIPRRFIDGPQPDLADNHPQASTIEPLPLSPEDPALIISTSGTTGRSKAALLPTGSPIGQARRVVQAMAYTPDDVLLSFFPWHHINARHATVLPALLTGARVVFTDRFSASSFLTQVRQEGITAFNFMGAVCMMLLAQSPTPYDRDHRLRAAYGGPAPPRLVADFKDRYGVILRQAYACTELGDVATTPVTELRPGAAGRPVADYELKVVDEHGVRVPDGTVGELVARPRRQGLVVKEYIDDPDATSEAWRDQWFRTRDRARLKDGWLYIEGRLGNVIRRRGVNINPDRIEVALLGHPDVDQVAAVAVPSELTEDEILAVVVPRAAATVAPTDLWEHCRRLLPRSCVPRYIALVEALPLNDSLKVDRAALRNYGVSHAVWDSERHRSLSTTTRSESP